MIKGLTGTCGITVSAGNTSLPYVPANNNNPCQGMLRINGTEMEVFNGSSWQQLPTSYATVSMDQDILDIVQWARNQRDQQLTRERRIENNPALKKAYEAIQRAEANYEILDKIVGEDGIQTTPA
jgi:hypothetical protein